MRFLLLSLGFIFLTGASFHSASISEVVSVVRLPNGQMDVLCSDHSREIVDEADLVANNVCPHIQNPPVASGQGDIIWVIDNSGSMSDYQQSIQINMNLFIREFSSAAQGTDWRMGLVSTDRTDSPYIGFSSLDRLDSSTTEPVLLFNQAVARLGTDGSPTEQPLEAVRNAITSHPDFLRPGAKLFVIVVTDEEDQSQRTVADYVSFLHSLVPAANITSYGVFGGLEPNCGSMPRYSGTRNSEFMQATNGTPYSICSPEYGRMLSAIAQDINTRINE